VFSPFPNTPPQAKNGKCPGGGLGDNGKGPYAAGDTKPPDVSGEADIATVDYIIPRSVCPELDNRLFNLEFMPGRMNSGKGARVSGRQLCGASIRTALIAAA